MGSGYRYCGQSLGEKKAAGLLGGARRLHNLEEGYGFGGAFALAPMPAAWTAAATRSSI